MKIKAIFSEGKKRLIKKIRLLQSLNQISFLCIEVIKEDLQNTQKNCSSESVQLFCEDILIFEGQQCGFYIKNTDTIGLKFHDHMSPFDQKGYPCPLEDQSLYDFLKKCSDFFSFDLIFSDTSFFYQTRIDPMLHNSQLSCIEKIYQLADHYDFYAFLKKNVLTLIDPQKNLLCHSLKKTPREFFFESDQDKKPQIIFESPYWLTLGHAYHFLEAKKMGITDQPFFIKKIQLTEKSVQVTAEFF
jgi:hypothetical protein